jgi:tRNA-intron endonuclease, archaea type
MEAFTAVYTNREIIIPTQAEADSLLQDGYGYRKNKMYHLRGVETLYNVERVKIHVVDEESNTALSFQELLHRLSLDDPELWIKFIVYKDLRQRGFIIEIQDQFKVYERGDYSKNPPSYQLKIISEGKPEQIKKLVTELKTASEQKLEMKLAVVDRRGEIVYYGVEEKKL